jgi:chromosome segregation ATPase
MFTGVDPMIEITKNKIEKVNEEIARLKIKNKTYESKITAIKAETVELRAEANRIIKEIQTETEEIQTENDEEIKQVRTKNSKITDALKAEVAKLEKENAELRVKKFVLETSLGKDVS